MPPSARAIVLAASLTAAALAAAALAAAAPAADLATLEGRIALDLAHALAARQRLRRAKAILERLAASHPALAEQAKRRAADIAAKLPPTPPRPDNSPLGRELHRANELMDTARCGAALLTYRDLVKRQSQGPIAQEARDGIAIVEQLADTLLAEAREAVAAALRITAALRLLVLRRDFAGTRAARAVGEQLAALKTTRQGTVALEAAAAALKMSADAEARTAKPKGPTTTVTRVGVGPQEAKARRLVQLARNFANNRMTERAKALCKKVLDQYPGTDAAAHAQALLGEIE